MGQFHIEDGWLYGRIGFQGSAGAELWDDDVKDFVPQNVAEGRTAPFIVHLESLRVAFQIRAGIIRPTTFTGNLQALLNAASTVAIWRVSHDVEGSTWDQWGQQVSRIVEIRTGLRRPNPNYHGRRAVEDLVEPLGAEMVSLIMSTPAGQLKGLNVDAQLIQQALAHAEDEYGTFQAKGVIDTPAGPEVSRWSASVEGAALQTEATEDPVLKEITRDDLLNALITYLDLRERRKNE